MTQRVVIVGSGPIGATFARRVLEGDDSATVLMVELGPQLTERPGMNLRNVADAAERDAARTAAQGPQANGGVQALAGHIVQEGTITARHGTHLVDFGGPGSGHAPSFPAAALATCVGGQGAHWTCATPEPRYSERIAFIPDDEWDGHLRDAEALLHVTHTAFQDSPIGRAINARLTDTFADEFPADSAPSILPVAADERPDGTVYWAGTDTVLGPLTDADGPFADRFELRAGTLARRVLHDDGTATGVLLEDVATGRRYEEHADTVVLAADAFRTPQILWASGIRPRALGHYLTEHPLVFSVIGLAEQTMRRYATTEDLERELARRALNPADPVSAVNRLPFWDPDHPFAGQFMYTDRTPFPLAEGSPWAGNAWGYVTAGYGMRKLPRYEDAVTFSDTETDYLGMPTMTVDYALTEHEEREIEQAKQYLTRAAESLGGFVPGGEPRLMPAGTSLHYQGTLRAGAVDDGTSVCDSWSRVWGTRNLIVGGNGVIPTATAANPTLTSVALAVRAADRLLAEKTAEHAATSGHAVAVGA
ncbi:MAG: GMC oxidoreductase [Microbacterium sp.]